MNKLYLFFLLSLFSNLMQAQTNPEQVFKHNIKSAKLFPVNNQLALPIIRLNSTDQLELHFDDIETTPKRYYYTLELCNADWEPVYLSAFDYLSGFTQIYLSEARPSSITLCKYIHYQTTIPDKNMVPTKSGNYLLRVYTDGDTSNTVFTKRMFVVDQNKLVLSAVVQQPFDNTINRTHQKVQISVNTLQLNVLNPQQQIKVVLLQNNRWDNAVEHIMPSFIRGSVLEYNGELDCVFPAGKEYRWLDLRSTRFASDRIDKINKDTIPVDIVLKPDVSRESQRYLYYKDYNGWYDVATTEIANPWWQTDYAKVKFTYVPPGNKPYRNGDVYILSNFTGNDITNYAKMKFNIEKGVYERAYLMKQGLYYYQYAIGVNKDDKLIGDVATTEGNYWEAENEYTVFVYYRSLNGRHDELLALNTINSFGLSLRN